MPDQEECRARVLFVDDEENILRSLKRLLMDEELDILTAGSGEVGLELLRNTPGVDLMVSDQRIQGLTGRPNSCRSRGVSFRMR